MHLPKARTRDYPASAFFLLKKSVDGEICKCHYVMVGQDFSQACYCYSRCHLLRRARLKTINVRCAFFRGICAIRSFRREMSRPTGWRRPIASGTGDSMQKAPILYWSMRKRTRAVPAFDHARLATALSHAAKQELLSRSTLPFSEIEFVEAGKAIRFSIDDVHWTCLLASYECQKSKRIRETANEMLSPNKRWAALRQGSQPVSERCFHGHGAAIDARRRRWVGLCDSFAARCADGRSGNGRREATGSCVLVAGLLEADHLSHRFAKFGTLHQPAICSTRISCGREHSPMFIPCREKSWRRPRQSSSIFNRANGSMCRCDSIELPFQDGPDFEWFPDSKSFYYDYDERGYKAKELRVVDASTGEQKVLVREQSDSYLDPGESFYRFVEADPESSLVVGARRLESSLPLQPENRTTGEPDHAGTMGSAGKLSMSTRKTGGSIFLPTGARRAKTRIRRILYQRRV